MVDIFKMFKKAADSKEYPMNDSLAEMTDKVESEYNVEELTEGDLSQVSAGRFKPTIPTK